MSKEEPVFTIEQIKQYLSLINFSSHTEMYSINVQMLQDLMKHFEKASLPPEGTIEVRPGMKVRLLEASYDNGEYTIVHKPVDYMATPLKASSLEGELRTLFLSQPLMSGMGTKLDPLNPKFPSSMIIAVNYK